MRDPEFIDIRNKFFLGIFIALLFTVPILLFINKTYASSDAMTKINKDDTFLMLVISNDCDKCKLVSDILKKNDIRFVKLNKDTAKDYDEIMQRMKIKNSREEFPIIVYVKKGEMAANLINITTEENIMSFLEFHQVGN